jgi:hypothetical protein
MVLYLLVHDLKPFDNLMVKEEVFRPQVKENEEVNKIKLGK